MADMLRPGGVLRLHDLVYDVSPSDAPALVDGWLRTASPEAAVGYTADDFATHVRTEFSTYRWLLEPLLEATGFEIVDVRVQRQACGVHLRKPGRARGAGTSADPSA